MKPNDYRYIWALGKLLGSDASYVREEQERAAKDNAPANATSWNYDGNGKRVWGTVDEYTEGSLFKNKLISLAQTGKLPWA